MLRLQNKYQELGSGEVRVNTKKKVEKSLPRSGAQAALSGSSQLRALLTRENLWMSDGELVTSESPVRR